MQSKLALQWIHDSSKITFLTGAGVSVPSGIPDYRSVKGVYHSLEDPEYLLSAACLKREPEKFYEFVKQLYHPEAVPNVIHQKIADLEQIETKQITVVTQNVDRLHQKAGSQNVVNFHGSLYQCYCERCGKGVDAKEYLASDIHEECGGRLRPGIVLYGEGLSQKAISQAIKAVESADLLVIAGTTFKVRPFCDLIYYANEACKIIVVNQERITLPRPALFILGNAEKFFQKIE